MNSVDIYVDGLTSHSASRSAQSLPDPAGLKPFAEIFDSRLG